MSRQKISSYVQALKIANAGTFLHDLAGEHHLLFNITKMDNGLLRQTIYYSVEGEKNDLLNFSKDLTQSMREYNKSVITDKKSFDYDSQDYVTFTQTLKYPKNTELETNIKEQARAYNVRATVSEKSNGIFKQKLTLNLEGEEKDVAMCFFEIEKNILKLERGQTLSMK